MASFELKLPDIGEGVNEGEVVRWLVKEGDIVKHDQPMVEVMTDKATVEIPCSSEGKVVKIVAQEGSIVKVGGTLLTMDGAGAHVGATSTPNAQPKSAAAPTPTPTPSGHERAAGQSISPPPAGEHVLATPATRRYARESGVDLNTLKGTGPVGRVTRDDVIKAGSHSQGTGAVAGGAKPQYSPPARTQTASGGEERKPLRGIRRKIAENLVRSKQTIPHFTHADECDVTELVRWRSSMKEVAAAKGVKLTYLPFIMKALVVTCREFPNFNSSIDDQAGEMVFKHSYNVGFAADTPEGLLVPVVKDVEHKSILEIAHDISTLAERARTGKFTPDDMRGGTITVTNIGSVGGVYATPIINHPEVAIIGVYKIQKKPVVINDEIKIREMMGVTATCDHRMIDGAQAAKFLNKFMKYLENPQSLLLEMV